MEEFQFKNKCFAKDLTIIFSMSNKQELNILDSIERYENVLKTQNIEQFNTFEKIQFLLNPNIIYGKYHSFLIEQKSIIKKDEKINIKLEDFNILYLFELIKRDRQGQLIKIFKNQFINGGGQFLKERNNIDSNYIFGKLNQSDGCSIDLSNLIFYELFHGMVKIKVQEANINNCYYRQSIRYHNYNHKKIYGDTRDNILNNEPSLMNWGKIEKDKPVGKLVLPTFKEICISVLKEMYLINNKSILNEIKKLPTIILKDFIQNCFQDEKPVGQEILFNLYNELILSNDNNFNLDELFPFELFLKNGIKREEWFRFNYCNSICQDFFSPYYNDRFSIDVYDYYHLFIKKDLPLDLSDQVLFKSETKDQYSNNQYSIVTKEQFLDNFNQFTNYLFKDLSKLPKGCLFIGGAISYCLYPITNENIEKSYQHSDIDVCFYSDNYSESQEAIMEFLENYFDYDESKKDNGISITKQKNNITISKHYPNRHCQININYYRSIEEILMGIDIDSSCFAFNGEKVYCLERSIHSFNYRMNFASNHSYLVRGDSKYQSRLFKYLNRGFDIFYINSKRIQSIINDKEFKPHQSKIGFSLLLSAKYSNEIFGKLNEKNEIDYTLPYGENWNKKKFDRFIDTTSQMLFDGYSVDPSVRQSIKYGEVGYYLDDYEEDRYNIYQLDWETNYTNDELIYIKRNIGNTTGDDGYSYVDFNEIKRNYFNILNEIE